MYIGNENYSKFLKLNLKIEKNGKDIKKQRRKWKWIGEEIFLSSFFVFD